MIAAAANTTSSKSATQCTTYGVDPLELCSTWLASTANLPLGGVCVLHVLLRAWSLICPLCDLLLAPPFANRITGVL